LRPGKKRIGHGQRLGVLRLAWFSAHIGHDSAQYGHFQGQVPDCDERRQGDDEIVGLSLALFPDEDHSRIRKGYGPKNMTRLRRFAIGIIKSKNDKSVVQTMQQLMLNTRREFDCLKMADNTCGRSAV
jgi:hypothetical protein